VTPAYMRSARADAITSADDVLGVVPVCSGAEQLTLHIPLAGFEIGSSTIPEHSVSLKNRFSQGGSHVIDLRVIIGATDVSRTSSLAEMVSCPAPPLTPAKKKNVSVCCHWKNKGWCKYQSQCKFQHPAHKRGVGAEVPSLHNICSFRS